MAGFKTLIGFLEKKSAAKIKAQANTNPPKAGGMSNCDRRPEPPPASGVESVGKPPGKRVRMKQSSFEVINKDGSLVLEVSAAGKGSNEDKCENLESIQEIPGKRKRPVRQCVESRRVKTKTYEEDTPVEGNTSKTGAKRKLKQTAASSSKELQDAVGVAVQCGGEALPMSTVEHSPKALGKAGSDFFLPTSKKRYQLKQCKLKSETPDIGVRMEKHANSEVAPQITPKRHKRGKEAKVDEGKSPQSLSSKKCPLKRKVPSLKNLSQLDASTDGDEAKLSNITFNLRLEAKQAAEENARLSAGRETHPFFMQQKSLQTRVTHASGGQMENNLQASRLSDAVLPPCPPFHITQNDQVDIAPLDWKGWEFIKSNPLQQDDPNGLKVTCELFSQASCTLLEGGEFSGFYNSIESSSSIEEKLPYQKAQSLDDLPKYSGCLDRTEKLIETLFAYLESHTKCTDSTVPVDSLKELGNKLTLEDLKKRFLSYFHRTSSGACNRPISMKNSLWTDKYQPETSEEVCGNSKSVMFLNDWLRSWHDRVFGSDKENNNTVQDDDWGVFQDESESLSKDVEGEGLKNVLLLTGPVGCGKSAALYACAKEQGFDVIEVNASECRSGALVKQKFGEAMESHGLNKWPVEDIEGLQDNKIVHEHLFSQKETRLKGNMLNKTENEKQSVAVSAATKRPILAEKEKHIYGIDERHCSQSRSKALILFEDVDTIFDDDRGFMAALLQLAETTKRPIVLTSNRHDLCLPRLLDRLTVEFELPSVEELVSHVFMVCIAEGVTICPSLVEHIVKCCSKDLRKILMLLQFWCQGKDNIVGDGQLCHMYSPDLFELDVEHLVIPKMMPWSFPCQLSESINLEISKALDEVKQQEWLHEAKLAEDCATRDRLLVQLKNKQKKMDQAEKKAAMLKRASSVVDDMEIFTALAGEVNETSKMTQSSFPSLGQSRRRRRHTVVTSDSDDITPQETVPDISETQLQVTETQFSVESTSASDDMTLSDSDVPGLSRIRRNSRGRTEFSTAVFRRLKKVQDVDLLETSSLKNVSFVPESLFVPETVLNGNTISHFESGDIGNTPESLENSVSNMYSPIKFKPELLNLDCPDKMETTMVPKPKLNRLEGVSHTGKYGYHCKKDTEMVVRNEDFTASQTINESSDAGLLTSKQQAKIVDNMELDTSRTGNKDRKVIVKCSEFNTSEEHNDNRSIAAAYEALPLMDECSRVGFTIGNIESKKYECLGAENPVQQTWLKMLNCREKFKPLLSSGCKDALSSIELATKLTDIISSSDLLLSSYELDHNNACKPSHGSRNVYLHGNYSTISCPDERVEITSTLAQNSLCLCAKRCSMMGSCFGDAHNFNLGKELLAASTNVVAMGKLILGQINHGMVWSEQFSKIGPSAEEQHSERQGMESKLSDALNSLVPKKSFFMAKGVAFHEYTSFLGRISKLEGVRLSHANTLKRRARGHHHYLNAGPNSLSSENIASLVQHSSYGEAPGR